MTRAAGSNSFSRDQPAGKLVFGIFAALAEFERGLIAERKLALHRLAPADEKVVRPSR